MRILRVHNRYQERGGEDVCFEAEVELLRDFGQDVQTLVFSNDRIPSQRSLAESAKLAVSTVWSRTGQHDVMGAIHTHQPDIVHFDNTFPMISPAAYVACRRLGVPVVQTLHNYRLLCPSATLFRNGAVCEDCLGKLVPIAGIQHSCYRDSRSQTLATATMLTAHRLRHTWGNDVTRYIALTRFAKEKFVEGGIPAHMIAVKPNFVTSETLAAKQARNHFLFVGRLAPEKGVATLLAAATHLESTKAQIRFAGSGALTDEVEQAATTLHNVRALGRITGDDVREEMDSAQALIFPSTWYEGFPMTIVEAFSRGLPVIASRLGSSAEIVEDGKTGLHFEPGDSSDLAAKMTWAMDHPGEMLVMGQNARMEYEKKYTPEHIYRLLMDIYLHAKALQQSSRQEWGPIDTNASYQEGSHS